MNRERQSYLALHRQGVVSLREDLMFWHILMIGGFLRDHALCHGSAATVYVDGRLRLSVSESVSVSLRDLYRGEQTYDDVYVCACHGRFSICAFLPSPVLSFLLLIASRNRQDHPLS